MAENTTVIIPAATWTLLTSADMNRVTFQNVGSNVALIKATTDATPPANTDGAYKYKPESGEIGTFLTDMFPGIAGADRVWAYSESGTSIVVSYGDPEGSSYYLDRSNHTGTQAISTITSLQTSLDEKLDKEPYWIDIAGDHKSVAVTASISSGSNILTATGAAFTSADVGKLIRIPGAGVAGARLDTTISGYTSASVVTLAANASTTLSSSAQTIRYGTDCTAHFQAAIDTALASGVGTIAISDGEYLFAGASSALDPGAGGISFVGRSRLSTIFFFEAAGTFGDDFFATSAQKHLFQNTDNTTKGGLEFRNIQFRGEFDFYNDQGGGHTMWLDYYESMTIENCWFNQLHRMAHDPHYIRKFRATNNWYTNIARDGCRYRDCDNSIIEGNYFFRCGDDSVAGHTATNTLATWTPVRKSMKVINNTLSNSGKISLLGSVSVMVHGNQMRLSNSGAVYVNTGTVEGANNVYDISICDNEFLDTTKVGTLSGVAQPPEPAPYVVYVGPHDVKGAAASNNTIPGRYNSTTGAIEQPYNWLDLDHTSASNPTPPAEGIRIDRNIFARRAKSGVPYSSLGYGQALQFGISSDPTITDAALRPSNYIVLDFTGTEINGLSICDNTFSGSSNGVYYPPITRELQLRNAKIARNKFVDVLNFGVIVNSGNFTIDLDISDNDFDMDPYRLASNSNIDGSYDADSVPWAINLGNVDGVSIRRNRFRNVAKPIASNNLSTLLLEDNIVYAGTPVAIDAYNAGNKGVGVPQTSQSGFRYSIIDADPTSANYGKHSSTMLREASAIPSSGWYYRGWSVRNTAPSVGGVIEWLRITTGTGHTLGTDWIAVYAEDIGAYTPTLTNKTNVSASTAYSTRYVRVGNFVRVSGRVSVTPTAASSTSTELGISLPIASNFSNSTTDAGGVGASGFGIVAGITADTTNDRLTLTFPASNTSANLISFVAEYTVI